MIIPENIEELKRGYIRYEIARKMNPSQWQAAWILNVQGKPFDEIIDEMAPYYGIKLK
jgi:hypothetical protein